jgi:hypothetical protein
MTAQGATETVAGFDSVPGRDDSKTSAGATYVPAANYASGRRSRNTDTNRAGSSRKNQEKVWQLPAVSSRF